MHRKVKYFQHHRVTVVTSPMISHGRGNGLTVIMLPEALMLYYGPLPNLYICIFRKRVGTL